MPNPITDVARSWTQLGKDDPLWAALTDAGRGGAWDVGDFLRTGQTEIDAVLALLRARHAMPANTDRALDFGCGPGRLTAALAAAGFDRAIGIDVSPTMLAKAEEIVPADLAERCSFQLNTANDLTGIESGTVDLVYTCRVLQHMPTTMSHAYIREFLRVVAPGGVVVFQLPAGPAPSAVGALMNVLPSPLLTRLRRGMQMHATPPSKITRLIADAGGVCVSIEEDTSAGPRWRSHLYIARPR